MSLRLEWNGVGSAGSQMCLDIAIAINTGLNVSVLRGLRLLIVEGFMEANSGELWRISGS